mmetsp:Transcript_5016/g.10414  ORF Transcript_5016/g.10414 Transcript_5016/m.10414 type:complete len:180 (-) Transcript_5016:286-825(-)|eukprot:CAMPEP_0171489344 /NCGR_PEP_ID=MMETSP0958-20121227/2707_1 /TAXON_ID=87120 /ORGANISM="Aurantiochytrium limacinum, Strain ATCCMYA-1381" /LENGTH=179 /DNA_ID=CAMNT_0012022551 /DNA_START=1093 /DNA_END=1632 /DNA_ORIENTATION=+
MQVKRADDEQSESGQTSRAEQRRLRVQTQFDEDEGYLHSARSAEAREDEVGAQTSQLGVHHEDDGLGRTGRGRRTSVASYSSTPTASPTSTGMSPRGGFRLQRSPRSSPFGFSPRNGVPLQPFAEMPGSTAQRSPNPQDANTELSPRSLRARGARFHRVRLSAMNELPVVNIIEGQTTA